MKRIFVFLLIFLIPTTSVKGYCFYNETARYKGLASNISASYEYVEKDGKLTFSITLNNLSEELYIIDAVTQKRYDYKSNEITIDNYEPGQTVKYEVYATNKFCSKDLLYTIRINLPGYNPYYSDPICEGLTDYIYCKKWHKHDLKYESFVKKVQDYKQSLIQEEIKEEPTVPNTNVVLQAILDVLLKYYQVILISIITICSVTIYIVNKKSNIYR